MWSRKANEIHAKLVSSETEIQGQDKRGKQEIQIQHITYNEARKQLPGCCDSVPHIGGVYKSRLARSSDDKMKEDSASSLRGKMNHMSGLRRKGLTLANSMKTRGRKKSVDSSVGQHGEGALSPLWFMTQAPVPMVSRKEKLLEGMREKWNRGSTTDVKEITQDLGKKTPGTGKPQGLHRRMKEGKMERVARPPSTGSIEKGCQPNISPPRPHQSPDTPYDPLLIDPAHSPSARTTPSTRKSIDSPRRRCNSRNQKTKSTTSTIASIFESGAEVLDETRRELQEMFKPPFENLNYPSFSLGRRPTAEDEGSDASFYCAGEKEDGEQGNEIKSNYSTRRLDEPTRACDAQEGDRRCRVCSRIGVLRPRNLCVDCEQRSLQGKEPSRPRYQHSNTEGKVIKLPLLNKDQQAKTFLRDTSQSEDLHPLSVHRKLNDPDLKNSTPPIPPRNKARCSAESTLRTPIIQPIPYSPSCQYGEIEISNAGANAVVDAWLPRCVEEDKFDRTQSLFKRWSESCEDLAWLENGTEIMDASFIWGERGTDLFGVRDELLKDKGGKQGSNVTI